MRKKKTSEAMIHRIGSFVLKKPTKTKAFNYRAMRTLMGFVALSLPILVLLFSGVSDLTSISVSYYTASRDIFVGFMFIVAAFFLAYNGYYLCDAIVSRVAAVAAAITALAPTECKFVTINICTTHPQPGQETIHIAAATVIPPKNNRG